MTTQTAPGIEIADPQGYRDKLDRLLRNKPPLAVLETTPDVIAAIIDGYTAEQLRTRPFEGKWTPNEILGHLGDGEWAYGWRIRLILGQDGATITGFDQERWVAVQAYNDREPADLLETFRNLRAANLALWRQVTPEQMNRLGEHVERGPESLGLMLRMHAGHDLVHIDQITRYLKAVGA